MNDELKKVLTDYLLRLLSAVEKGVEFTADQIPLVIQEKLTYDFWESALWATLFYTLTIISCGGLSISIRAADKRDWEDTLTIILVITFAVLSCAGIGWFLEGGEEVARMLKIHLAPKLYILEWLRASL